MRWRGEGGFALVLTLSLLALAVVVAVAIAMTARVGSRMAATAELQTQARQNALLGLGVALDQLQTTAGPDGRITAMAGMAGELPQSSFRHWCGVWRVGAAAPEAWLVSGAGNGAVPQLSSERIVIVGTNTVGNPADRTDQELVEVGLVELPETERGGRGRFAYWVGDEGVKVSAVVRGGEAQVAGASGVELRANVRRLVSGSFSAQSAAAAKVESFEQLKQAATGVSLTGSFHALTHRSVALPATAVWGMPSPEGRIVGAFNVNTTSEAAWRAWLEYPDHNDAVFGQTANRTLSGARRIRDLFAQRGRPFASVEELEASGLIQAAFDSASPKITTITAEEFFEELRPVLTTRSDTFRVRAYGEATTGTGGMRAVAYCEAGVQRTAEIVDGAVGRRFVVTYFRWLLPEDV